MTLARKNSIGQKSDFPACKMSSYSGTECWGQRAKSWLTPRAAGREQRALETCIRDFAARMHSRPMTATLSIPAGATGANRLGWWQSSSSGRSRLLSWDVAVPVTPDTFKSPKNPRTSFLLLGFWAPTQEGTDCQAGYTLQGPLSLPMFGGKEFQTQQISGSRRRGHKHGLLTWPKVTLSSMISENYLECQRNKFNFGMSSEGNPQPTRKFVF